MPARACRSSLPRYKVAARSDSLKVGPMNNSPCTALRITHHIRHILATAPLTTPQLHAALIPTFPSLTRNCLKRRILAPMKARGEARPKVDRGSEGEPGGAGKVGKEAWKWQLYGSEEKLARWRAQDLEQRAEN